MIKNFDEFVNGNEQITEGKFFDNVIGGIEAGIAAFKANRHMNKAIEKDNEKLTVSKLLDDTKEYDRNTQLAILVDGLLNRTVCKLSVRVKRIFLLGKQVCLCSFFAFSNFRCFFSTAKHIF